MSSAASKTGFKNMLAGTAYREKTISVTSEMDESLVDGASSIAGFSGGGQSVEELDDIATRRPAQRSTLAGLRAVLANLGGVLRRTSQNNTKIEEGGSDSRTGLGDRTDAEHRPGSTAQPADAHGEALGPLQDNVAQQGHEALAASVDCPLQRLQNKLRPHNSTDPRPAFRQQSVEQSRCASCSSDGSCCSSSRSSRFSFGLLLQPSSALREIRSSLGGRGSGWSLWFRQDDGGKAKPSPQDARE